MAVSSTIARVVSGRQGDLATALVADSTHPLGGRLWAWKPFAKDGSIAFSAGAAVSALEILDLPCTLTAQDSLVDIRATPVAGRSVSVSSKGAQFVVAKQTEP